MVSSSAWVRSDPILLERIVLNLVSNAVRYTTSGGVVVGCRRRGDTVHIEVWDSGPGIPEDQRRKIFGEFYRVAEGNTPGGVGLGLAIVERLCSLLGHRVELNSRLGRGSRFLERKHVHSKVTAQGSRGAPLGELGCTGIQPRNQDACLPLQPF